MPASLPLILLPPSEGKAPGGEGDPWARGTMALALDDRRDEVLDAVARAMRSGAAARGKLLGVKGAALAAATEADRGARRAPTMPAIERYTGVLYDALDHRSLGAAQRRRLDASVLIVSGLWGAVAPADPIPDYKLKMGAALPRLGRLSTWWRDDLSAAIAERAVGRAVWNLLPQEHAAAWRAPSGIVQRSVRFLERRPDGSFAAVSHSNKVLKGILVRYLLTHPGAGPDDLRAWRHPSGYRLDPARTEDAGNLTLLSFIRE
ncbi:MAG: peroxide stress protein YaaA [Actinomycetota bacterium]